MKWRELTAVEHGLVERLLSVQFPGRDEVAVQIRHALVRQLDREGSLGFRVSTDIVAPVKKRIPIEAQALDGDGTWIHALLHVVAGKVAELEIYKDDSSPVIELPHPEQWELLQCGPSAPATNTGT